MDQYTPAIIEGKYATFLLRLEKCPACQRHMVVRPQRDYNTFPYYCGINFVGQANSAGLGIRSNSQLNNEYICTDCEGEGKASFVCELCKQQKTTDLVQEQYGAPPEYLCIGCYTTVSAKVWDETCERLRKEHKYDYP